MTIYVINKIYSYPSIGIIRTNPFLVCLIFYIFVGLCALCIFLGITNRPKNVNDLSLHDIYDLYGQYLTDCEDDYECSKVSLWLEEPWIHKCFKKKCIHKRKSFI